MMVNLSKKQLETLKIHKKHHSAKHLKYMKNKMKQGSTFTQSHKLAKAKVGN